MTSFRKQLPTLPRLGVGISCEYDGGTRPLNINAIQLQDNYPQWVHFLEIGTDVARGLDSHMQQWIHTQLPTTYHFLDINLEEEADIDDTWLTSTVSLAGEMQATWLCGDAGMWHFGTRERGHYLLLPPILTQSSADEMSRAISRIQNKTGYLVLPENPPAHGFTYIDDTHCPAPLDACWTIFEYVCERAKNLKAVVYECEHNHPNEVLPTFERLNEFFPKNG